MLELLILLASAEPEGALSLERCRTLARMNAAAVQEAKYELESAVQTRRAARVKYFPQVSATAGIMKAKDPLVEAGTDQPMNLPVYDGNPANLAAPTQFAFVPPISLQAGGSANVVSITALQPLYAGGRIVNGNRLASLGAEVARSKLELSERDAVAQAEEKYWMLVGLAQTRRTLDAYDTMLGALERQVGDAVGSGVTGRNDMLKVGLERGRLRVHRLELDNGVRLAARDLRRHLGFSDDTALVLSDTLDAPMDPVDLGDRRASAVDRRIETKLLAKGVEAERLQRRMEVGAMLPSVAVGATATRMDMEDMDPFTNVIVFGMATIPVTDVWARAHAASSRRAKEHAAEVREIDARRMIAMGVEKDWGDLQTAWQTNLVAEDALAQADENLAVETDRHRAGVGSLSDLLEAQALRQKSLEERVSARRSYWLRRSAFLRATGGLD